MVVRSTISCIITKYSLNLVFSPTSVLLRVFSSRHYDAHCFDMMYTDFLSSDHTIAWYRTVSISVTFASPDMMLFCVTLSPMCTND